MPLGLYHPDRQPSHLELCKVYQNMLHTRHSTNCPCYQQQRDIQGLPASLAELLSVCLPDSGVWGFGKEHQSSPIHLTDALPRYIQEESLQCQRIG